MKQNNNENWDPAMWVFIISSKWRRKLSWISLESIDLIYELKRERQSTFDSNHQNVYIECHSLRLGFGFVAPKPTDISRLDYQITFRSDHIHILFLLPEMHRANNNDFHAFVSSGNWFFGFGLPAKRSRSQ